jgi:hypothetical protein
MKLSFNQSANLKGKKSLSYTCKGPSSGIMVMIVWHLDLQLSMQSVPITANVVSSNIAQARCTQYNSEVYSIQHYVRKFVNEFLRFPPSIKLAATI